MKATELREKTADDLRSELDGLQLQQFKLRMAKATGQLAKTHQVGQVRRDIARIKTVLTQKQGG